METCAHHVLLSVDDARLLANCLCRLIGTGQIAAMYGRGETGLADQARLKRIADAVGRIAGPPYAPRGGDR